MINITGSISERADLGLLDFIVRFDYSTFKNKPGLFLVKEADSSYRYYVINAFVKNSKGIIDLDDYQSFLYRLCVYLHQVHLEAGRHVRVGFSYEEGEGNRTLTMVEKFSEAYYDWCEVTLARESCHDVVTV